MTEGLNVGFSEESNKKIEDAIKQERQRIIQIIKTRISELESENKDILDKRQHPHPFAPFEDDELKQKAAYNLTKAEVLSEIEGRI